MKKPAKKTKRPARNSKRTKAKKSATATAEREYHKCKFCRQEVLFVDGVPFRITSGAKLAQSFCPGRAEEFCKAIEP